MKGIVVDLNDKYAVVLDKKGGFIKVKNNGKFTIGNEIDIGLRATNHNFKTLSKITSVAAGLLLLFGIGIGGYAYSMPYNYINVDINPSLEFTVNVFGVVLDVKGLNSDGEDLIKNTRYNRMKIDRAVEGFIEAALDKGFLEDVDKNTVMITVSGKNEEKLSDIQEELVKVTNDTLEHSKVQSEVVAEKVTLNKRDNAKELGISPGKLVLIEKLQKEKPEVKIEEYKEKPVKDILASIKHVKKEAPKKPKDQTKTLPDKENKAFDKLKDHEKDNKANTDKKIKEDISKELPNKVSNPPSDNLKDKEKQDREEKGKTPDDKKPKDKEIKSNDSKHNEPKDDKQKNNEPKDNGPKDNKPKDNEPKDNKLKDNETKDNGPKDNEQKDNKPRDNESKDNEPKDNKQKGNEPKDNKPKDNELKGDELKKDIQYIDDAPKKHEEKIDETEKQDQENTELQDGTQESETTTDLEIEGVDEKESAETLKKNKEKDDKNTLDY
jgi:hypothetical protein